MQALMRRLVRATKATGEMPPYSQVVSTAGCWAKFKGLNRERFNICLNRLYDALMRLSR